MAIWLKIKAYVIAIAAAVSAVIGIYLYGRKSGAAQEMQRSAEKDREKARRIEDAADKARDSDIGDPAEFLRKRGRLRRDGT